MSLKTSTLRSAPAARATKVARVVAWVCGAMLLAMSFVITAEALLRKFLNFSFGGVDEVTSYVFAITATWAFSFAVLERAHIRIDLVRGWLPRPLRTSLDVLSWLCFTLVFSAISYRALALAWDSWQSGARSISPMRSYLAIPQGLWAAGLAACVLALVAVGVKAVRLALAGHGPAAADLLAPTPGIAATAKEGET